LDYKTNMKSFLNRSILGQGKLGTTMNKTQKHSERTSFQAIKDSSVSDISRCSHGILSGEKKTIPPMSLIHGMSVEDISDDCSDLSGIEKHWIKS
jgi:hypothetical protein